MEEDHPSECLQTPDLPDCERKPGQVPRMLARQEDLLATLRNVVGLLQKRLEPITGPTNPDSKPESENRPLEPMVKVAQHIQGNNDQLANLIARLERTISRIEI